MKVLQINSVSDKTLGKAVDWNKKLQKKERYI